MNRADVDALLTDVQFKLLHKVICKSHDTIVKLFCYEEI